MANSKSEEYVKRRVERLLSNNMEDKDGKPKPLIPVQLKKLNEWAKYYSSLPSSKGGKIKITSLWNSLFRLRDLGIYLDKPFEQASTEDLVKFFETQFTKEQVATRSGSKVVVGQFYKWLGLEDVVSDPRLKAENTRKSKITPKSLPTRDEIMKLLKACPTYFAKAVIMLCYGEAGMRANEIVTLTRDCVEFDQYGAKVWINKSKSDERYVRLTDTVPYLQRYIELEYDLEGDPSKLPLFYGHHRFKGEWMLPTAINQIIGRAKKKAGIKKRLWCHGGRHASISRCHKLGMDVDTIARRHGITAQTVRNTYLHFDDKDVDEAYLKAKGLLSDEDKVEQEREKQKLSPKECPRCGKINTAEAKFCNDCSMILDIETAYQLEEARESTDTIIEKTLKNKGSVSKELFKEVIRDMIKSGEIEIN